MAEQGHKVQFAMQQSVIECPCTNSTCPLARTQTDHGGCRFSGSWIHRDLPLLGHEIWGQMSPWSCLCAQGQLAGWIWITATDFVRKSCASECKQPCEVPACAGCLSARAKTNTIPRQLPPPLQSALKVTAPWPRPQLLSSERPVYIGVYLGFILGLFRVYIGVILV